MGYIFIFWFYLYLVDVRHFDLLRAGNLSSFLGALSVICRLRSTETVRSIS